MLAKDRGVLGLEITFCRHSTRNNLTNDFIHCHMIHLKELLPNEIKYHNPINNQFNLVCNNVIHFICI